jgi:hypothetical protein
LAYGRSPEPGSRVQPIESDVWVEASISDDNAAITTDGYGDFVDVRIIANSGLTEPGQRSIGNTPPARKPGRPTKARIIRSAIGHFAQDPGWFVKKSPDERLRAYKSYISQVGHDPDNEPGFNKKTFQKYEREFRS